MQRHATLAIPLAAAHFSATQTTSALDTDTLCAALAGRLNGLAHCTTECNAVFKLLSNGLSNEACVKFRTLNLYNLNGNRAVGDLVELLAKCVNLCTLLADYYAGARRGDDDLDLVTSALDLYAGDSCMGELLVKVRTNSEVVLKVFRIVLVGIPAAAPILGYAETETGGAYFLTHTMPPLGLLR